MPGSSFRLRTIMNHLVRDLFHELAGLTVAERDRIFAERWIAADLRAEVESLLDFDATSVRSFNNVF
jgi:hypothetical protein